MLAMLAAEAVVLLVPQAVPLVVPNSALESGLRRGCTYVVKWWLWRRRPFRRIWRWW